MFKPIMLGKNIKIHEDVKFGSNVIIYDNVEILKGSIISHNVILGDCDKKYYSDEKYENKKTLIKENCFIRPFSIVSSGVEIGNNTQLGDKVLIRSGTKIGNNCSIGTMCDLQGNLSIKDNVRLHSNVHVGAKTIIEKNVWIYPFVVITNDPNPPKGILLSTTIGEFSQIASNCVLMPGIKIGTSSFVGAGSIVTKDVKNETLVFGSPAKEICSVRELKDLEGKQYLPWQEFRSK